MIGRDRDEWDEEDEVEEDEEEIDDAEPDDDFDITPEQGEALDRLLEGRLTRERKAAHSMVMNERIRQAFGKGG